MNDLCGGERRRSVGERRWRKRRADREEEVGNAFN
jgi:hypothetical protein